MAITAVNFDDRENLLLAAKMTHNQEIIDVAEVLNEVNDPIMDFIVQRANDITSHVISRRTALPGSEWVKVGNGWDSTTGLLNQVREHMGQLKARYLCPKDVMRLQPNQDKYRTQQERAYIESMGQELVNTLFGNYTTGDLDPTTDPPEEFAGLQRRYGTLSTGSSYVVSNGHTTDDDTNTSIWFIQHGPGKVYLTHPRNTEGGGLKQEDMGLVYTLGDNASASASQKNKQLWAYITEFSWDVGLAIEDMRSVKRLCNIDPDHTATNTLNEDYIIQIRNNFKGSEVPYMYCNETTFTQLQILAKDKTNVHWTENNPFGKPQLYFLDMPIRRCDGISNAEPVLT